MPAPSVRVSIASEKVITIVAVRAIVPLVAGVVEMTEGVPRSL